MFCVEASYGILTSEFSYLYVTCKLQYLLLEM
jgi:hypothetical protein